MKRTEIDFDKDISIDRYKLDDECVSHSGLFYRYLELAAEAKNQVGVLSDALKLKMGEANINIRNVFIKKDMKFTEAVIASEVEKDDDVVEAREALRKAELTLARIQAGVSAMEHRKSQLDNLVKLYCAGYFSTPAQSGKGRESVNDQVSREARSGLNKNRRLGTLAKEEDDDV